MRYTLEEVISLIQHTIYVVAYDFTLSLSSRIFAKHWIGEVSPELQSWISLRYLFAKGIASSYAFGKGTHISCVC